MPLLEELSTAKQTILSNYAVPHIGLKIVLKGNSLVVQSVNVDGTWNLSTTYHPIEIDVSERLSGQHPVRIRSKKPILPSSDGFATRGANVEITFINHDGPFALVADGAIFDPGTIRQLEVQIYSTFGTEEHLHYTGRAIGPPKEEFGETTFTFRDALYEIIDIPVRMGIFDAAQNTVGFPSGLFTATPYTFPSGMQMYDTYTAFRENGLAFPHAESTNLESLNLLDVEFPPGHYPISKYEIEFDTNTTFIFRSPTAAEESGNIGADFTSSEGIIIRAASWNIAGGADIVGDKFSIFTYFNAFGNPFTIIKAVLEWAFLNSWDNATLTQPTTIPVNWDKLDELEDYFENFFDDPYRVYVAETNSDPKVYGYQNDAPFSVKRLIEKIGFHVGCSLDFDQQGRVTFSHDHRGLQTLYPDIDSTKVLSHYFQGRSAEYTDFRLLYGLNPVNGNYSSEITLQAKPLADYDNTLTYNAGDIVLHQGQQWVSRNGSAAGGFNPAEWQIHKVKEFRIAFDYYKRGVSFLQATERADLISKRAFLASTRVSVTLPPQYGLTVVPGDKFRAVFTIQPAKTIDLEVIEVNLLPGQPVSLVCVEIPSEDTERRSRV